MKTEIKIERKVKNSKLLVVTPLLPNHKISDDTKKTIKRNDIEFDWIQGIGENNIPTNVQNALAEYEKLYGILKYYIMIDNDIILGRHMLDKLYEVIEKSPNNVAYAYANFEFKGYINAQFPAIPFDPKRLMYANYISSNSMFKWDIVKKVGLVTDDKYKRLLDWAFLLKLYDNGYIGIPAKNASFIAKSTRDDISAGNREDYNIKSKRVREDFIDRIVERKFI